MKQSLRFLGVNAAGLGSKILTFKKVINELNPAVFFIEETKFRNEGRLKLDKYHIFERIRKSQDGGGGLALGCLKELQPVWVREGDDLVEAMSVEIFLKNLKIRCCVAYGFQESEKVEIKDKFWTYLNEEVYFASQTNAGFVLQFDGNLWAGSDIIPGDPKTQNRNGKMFENFLNRHPHLTVVNSLSICEGLVTRSRLRDGKLEESVLDFFVVCSKILPFVSKMVIDERKEHVLTNYKNAKTIRNFCYECGKDCKTKHAYRSHISIHKGLNKNRCITCGKVFPNKKQIKEHLVVHTGRATNSDHNTEYMDLELKIENIKPGREEFYNFKNKKGQILFKRMTSNTSDFTECFKNMLPLSAQINNWLQVLDTYSRKSFKKIRIKSRSMKPISKKIATLIDTRNGEKIENVREALEKKVADYEAEEKRNKLMEQFSQYKDNPENINVANMWKILKKLWPKFGYTVPTAKKNHQGKLITGAKELKLLMLKEYTQRLRNRPLRPDLKHTSTKKDLIFQLKMKIAQKRQSSDWTMKNLDEALSKLKNNKSRDSLGYINEIFQPDTIGDDLKASLLVMFNQLKKKKMIAKFMNFANITTVPKKGSKLLLQNERGIFRVPVIRSILMRLIYDRKYPKIDRLISDCQMGGRKRKGCKNNIFILNGLIHDVLSSKKMKPILLQFYDFQQMFDSINLKEAISDLYSTGVNDDNLELIYKANDKIHMAVKTDYGLTDRQIISNSVLQGDTWGSILAAVQVDKMGQDCIKENHFYLYKSILPVGFLGLIDDVVGITEAGCKAQMLNSFMNIKSAEKNLQFGSKKCKSILVGKNKKNFPNNRLVVDTWNISYEENKETGSTDMIEKYEGKIEIEQVEEYTYLGFVISSTGDNMAHIRKMKKQSIGVIKRIISKLESLNLRKYFYECSKLFMNVMLRPSILYSIEMCYNMKEIEVRQIERVEEVYMRKILNTSRGCPITQLYLEFGQYPARFEIKKMRLLYLKYILEQPEDSQLKKFFKIQLNNPTRGDWASTCQKDLKYLNIPLSHQEIQKMTKYKFTNLLKEKINEEALNYLKGKRSKKGKHIEYKNLEMAEYLQPTCELDNREKQKLFEIRNDMTNIPSNYGKQNECLCGELEHMIHIYNCEFWSERKSEIVPYNNIYNGNIQKQIEVCRIFEQKLERRNENMKTENTHVILNESTVFPGQGLTVMDV